MADFEVIRGTKFDGYLRMPVDEATGVPLSFSPLWLSKSYGRTSDYDINLHHAFQKADVKNAFVDDSLGEGAEEAFIGARGQLISVDDHILGVNELFKDTPIPKNKRDGFRTLCFAYMGYVPAQTVVFTKNYEPRLKELSTQERLNLWSSGIVRVIDELRISNYIINYCAETKNDHIQDKAVYDFFKADDYGKKLLLANKLASLIVDRAVQPFHRIYVDANKEGAITPINTKEGVNAPSSPREYMLYRMRPVTKLKLVTNTLKGRVESFDEAQKLVA